MQAFKIALTKAKRAYLHHRSSSHFIPTDIVPLINQARKASFDRKEWVQKAIAACGWNPLNYCLLDHPGVKKAPTDVVDLTINNNDDAAKSIALPAQPNVAGALGSYYIDKLIEEDKKNEGRQKKYKEEKDSIKTKEEKAEKVLQMAKVSSSVLAANNHFVLGPEVLELVHKNEQTMEFKKLESKRKQDEAKKKLDDKYWNAMRKVANMSALTVDDMKSVLM
jgi:hypothetical protein